MVGRVDPLASETRLKQLIAREPSGFLYASLGNLHAEQNQWAAAQQAYFHAFQIEPSNPDYAFNLAVGLEHLGQRGIAAGYYRQALDLARLRGHAGFDQARVAARLARQEPVGQ
jgi:tetratricopeptide (TPR) repeat protein